MAVFKIMQGNPPPSSMETFPKKFRTENAYYMESLLPLKMHIIPKYYV